MGIFGILLFGTAGNEEVRRAGETIATGETAIGGICAGPKAAVPGQGI